MQDVENLDLLVVEAKGEGVTGAGDPFAHGEPPSRVVNGIEANSGIAGRRGSNPSSLRLNGEVAEGLLQQQAVAMARFGSEAASVWRRISLKASRA